MAKKKPAQKSVVVLSDFSDKSASALARGIGLAKDLAMPLHVVHVMDDVPEPFFDVIEPQRRRLIEAVEPEIVAQAKAAGLASRPSVATRSGTIFAETLVYAQEHNAAFVVVGKDAYRDPAHRTLPINALVHKLARHTDRPILVSKRGGAGYAHALALVDLSANSAAGLAAIERVLPKAAKLTVLYCTEPPPYPAPHETLPVPPINYGPIRETMIKQGKKALRAFMSKHPVQQRDVELIVEFGMTVERATRFLERHDCSLVAVGTRGRGPLASVMLGSIAEAMIELAHCDVLVAPPPGKAFKDAKTRRR